MEVRNDWRNAPRAAAHAVITLAQNTVTINGKRGKGNFKPKPEPDHPVRR